MANIGFKATIGGKNVLQTTDPRNFLVWSKYPPLKITKYGAGNLTITGGSFVGPLTIRHGLSYAPGNLAYIDLDNNGKWWLSNTFIGGTSFLTNPSHFIFGANKTNLTWSTVFVSGTYVRPFRYVLFDEPAYDVASGADKPLGYIPANIGFKVSKANQNILTAKLFEQNINSNCDFLKVHKIFEGSLTITGAGEFSQEFIHGLGYVPLFFGWAKNDVNGEEPLPFAYFVPGIYGASIYADTNKIVIAFKKTAAGAGSLPFRLIVWKNSINGDA
jgi:hypothetical protein